MQYNDACYLFVDLPTTGDAAATYCSENDASELAAVSNLSQRDFLTQTLRESKPNNTKWLVHTTGSNLSNLCSALRLVDDEWDLVETNCSTPLPFICQDAAGRIFLLARMKLPNLFYKISLYKAKLLELKLIKE